MIRHLTRAVESIEEGYLSNPAASPRRNSGFLRKYTRRRPAGSPWTAYEAAKSAWIASHPVATPAEYTAAMTRIARQCGV